MSDAPCFTIGIPVYNGEAYLRSAIVAALEQDFPDFEVVVSDNASTDRTQDICSEFLANPKFRYYRQERNLGPIGNFEFVLAQSRAKYFKWLAHDDLCSPDLLSRAKREFDTDTSIVCVAFCVQVVDADGHLIQVERLSGISRSADWRDTRLLFFEFPISNVFHAVYGIFRRDVLAKYVIERGALRPTYKKAMTNGECYFLACIATAGRIVAVDELLLSYRVHAASIYETEMSRLTYRDSFVRGMFVRLQLVSAAANANLPLADRFQLMLHPFRGLLRSARRRALRLFSPHAHQRQ